MYSHIIKKLYIKKKKNGKYDDIIKPRIKS